jgi:hypothetical protein
MTADNWSHEDTSTSIAATPALSQVALSNDRFVIVVLQAPDQISVLVVLRWETFEDLIGTFRCIQTR